MIRAHSCYLIANSRVLFNSKVLNSVISICSVNNNSRGSSRHFSCTVSNRPSQQGFLQQCSVAISHQHHHHIQQNYYSTDNTTYTPTPQEQEQGKRDEKKLRRYKKIFSSILFTSTLALIAYARRKKQDILTENFEGCIRLPVDENFHGGHREFFRCHSPSNTASEHQKGTDSVLPAQMLKDGTVKAIKSFKVRPNDVIVASFPKTGTTWVQEIVYLLENDMDFEKASEKVLENRFPYLEYPYPGLTSVVKMPSPRLIKTHLPLNFLPDDVLSAKVIYITRNPKDTVVSYFHFSRMLAFSSYEGSFEEFLSKFKNDELPYCPFFGHVESYTSQEDNPNLLIVTYEDLTRDPAEVIKKIARFLDKPLTDTEINLLVQHTSFKEMAKNPSVNYSHWDELGIRNNSEAQFMRKGKVGDWRNYFSNSINNDFDLWIKNNNKKGFKFDYKV